MDNFYLKLFLSPVQYSRGKAYILKNEPFKVIIVIKYL